MAQDLFWVDSGAYTGEISGPMLVAAGATYAIVGHSERRQYFAESDETVLKRTQAALEFGLTPIVCVGERLEERESGSTEAVLVRQFQKGIAGLSEQQFARIVIAYEPVWAIGTGKTATPEIAADAHRVIRGQARAKFGKEAGDYRNTEGYALKVKGAAGAVVFDQELPWDVNLVKRLAELQGLLDGRPAAEMQKGIGKDVDF
jgi:triosephosphate isomerase